MKELRKVFAVTALVVAASGCSEPTGLMVCEPNGPGPSIEGERRDSLIPTPAEFRDVNDEWADVARQVPGGWGGLFSVGGQLTMYLVEPNRLDDAVTALVSLGISDAAELSNVAVWPGRWNFAQLYDWRRYIDIAVELPEGVVSSDLDEARNRIVYGVRDAPAASAFSSLLDAANLPCALVLVEVEGAIQPD